MVEGLCEFDRWCEQAVAEAQRPFYPVNACPRGPIHQILIEGYSRQVRFDRGKPSFTLDIANPLVMITRYSQWFYWCGGQDRQANMDGTADPDVHLKPSVGQVFVGGEAQGCVKPRS